MPVLLWSRSLTHRHAGTGLFVASGKALQIGGPASLLIAYSLIGAMLYCTVQALGEMAVLLPVAGSFSAYSTRFLDPAWGFAMGWNYCLQWLVALPLEVVAASITVKYWNSHINSAAWVAIFLLIIISINLFGVKGYGEAEFIFSIVKIIAVIGFMYGHVNPRLKPSKLTIIPVFLASSLTLAVVPMPHTSAANTGLIPEPSTTASKACALSS